MTRYKKRAPSRSLRRNEAGFVPYPPHSLPWDETAFVPYFFPLNI